ncbi:glycogen branching enzyme, partial [gut metagenome]
GSYKQKFDQVRLLYFYMLVHPGKKLNFMGGEIGMFREWDENRELDWGLLGYPQHKGLEQLIIRLGELYEHRPELHCGEYHPARFEWLVREAKDEGIFAFVRKGPDGKQLLAVLNTLPVFRPEFPICRNGFCHAVPLLCT